MKSEYPFVSTPLLESKLCAFAPLREENIFEGFGSLDEEKLDEVMNALEKLHNRDRMVEVISHVREMKERLPGYLEVVAAEGDGSGIINYINWLKSVF